VPSQAPGRLSFSALVFLGRARPAKGERDPPRRTACRQRRARPARARTSAEASAPQPRSLPRDQPREVSKAEPEGESSYRRERDRCGGLSSTSFSRVVGVVSLILEGREVPELRAHGEPPG